MSQQSSLLSLFLPWFRWCSFCGCSPRFRSFLRRVGVLSTDQIQEIILTSGLFALYQDQPSTLHYMPISHSYLFSIPTPPKLGSERRQLPRLVLFYIQQLVTRGIPHWRVSYVLCGFVDGHGRGRPVEKGAAIAEGDELCEGVGALRAAEESRVSDLPVGVVLCLGGQCTAQSAEGGG
jgi:hypothetical protein